jgi:hypothetical protein
MPHIPYPRHTNRSTLTHPMSGGGAGSVCLIVSATDASSGVQTSKPVQVQLTWSIRDLKREICKCVAPVPVYLQTLHSGESLLHDRETVLACGLGDGAHVKLSVASRPKGPFSVYVRTLDGLESVTVSDTDTIRDVKKMLCSVLKLKVAVDDVRLVRARDLEDDETVSDAELMPGCTMQFLLRLRGGGTGGGAGGGAGAWSSERGAAQGGTVFASMQEEHSVTSPAVPAPPECPMWRRVSVGMTLASMCTNDECPSQSNHDAPGFVVHQLGLGYFVIDSGVTDVVRTCSACRHQTACPLSECMFTNCILVVIGRRRDSDMACPAGILSIRDVQPTEVVTYLGEPGVGADGSVLPGASVEWSELVLCTLRRGTFVSPSDSVQAVLRLAGGQEKVPRL